MTKAFPSFLPVVAPETLPDNEIRLGAPPAMTSVYYIEYAHGVALTLRNDGRRSQEREKNSPTENKARFNTQNMSESPLNSMVGRVTWVRTFSSHHTHAPSLAVGS